MYHKTQFNSAQSQNQIKSLRQCNVPYVFLYPVHNSPYHITMLEVKKCMLHVHVQDTDFIDNIIQGYR